MLGRSRGPIKSPFAAMKSPLWTTLPSWSVYVPIVSTRYGCDSETGIVFGRTDWPYNYDEESSNFTDETPKNFLNSSGVATTGSLVKIDSGGRTFNTGVTLTSTRNLNFGGV